MLKRIHVNQHVIRANRKAAGAINPEQCLIPPPQPVITVKHGKTNTYGFEVEILGPSRVCYRPDKPLSCGAEVWVETEAAVRVDGQNVG